MTKKDMLKNEILLKMKYYLNTEAMMILERTLSECFYQIDIVDATTLPATMDATNEYILELYQLKRSMTLKESTMKAYMLAVRDFLKYIPKPLTMVTKDDVEYFLREKQREGNNGASMNNKKRKINALFVWMKKQRFIRENPMDDIDNFKETRKPVDYLLAEDVEQLKEGCVTKRDRALLEWLRSTACRKGEIPYVKINQINWTSGELILYGEKTDTYRKVYLDGVALRYIREYIEEERHLDIRSDLPLFTCLNDSTKVLKKSGIYAEIKRIAKNSGITRRVYPHLFRKTAATNVVKRGGTADDAACYIGHKGSDVTRRHYIAQKDPEMVFRLYVAAV